MRILQSKNGSTVVHSKEYQLFDKLRHENGIYEVDLNESDLHCACQLRQRGVVIKIRENGKIKYKAYPQK
tara:strand:+ start:1046 stop:1255 length:210 start_codon:yes stop_codon:yes gene_type:complete